MYLGAKLRKVQIDDDTKAWAQSSASYVKGAVKNVEKWCHMSTVSGYPVKQRHRYQQRTGRN